AAEELITDFPESGPDRLMGARTLVGCKDAVEKDKSLPEADRGAAAKKYVDRAVDWLRQVRDNGTVTLAELQSDPGLNPIRMDPRFQTLLAGPKLNDKK